MSRIRVKQLHQGELESFVDSVISGDLQSIETELSGIVSTGSILSGAFSDISNSVDSISDQNLDISGRLNAIESIFSSFDVDLTTISGQIDDLESATGILYEDISGALDSISGLETGLSYSQSVNNNYIFNYVHLADIKASGVGGGSFSGGSWRTRDLNTEISDSGNLASLSSNIINLQSGLYSCFISCPALGVGSHIARLYNLSDSQPLLSGTTEFAGNFSSRSVIVGRFRVTGATGASLCVQHLCSTTVNNSGFSSGSSLADPNIQNIYTIAEFNRILS